MTLSLEFCYSKGLGVVDGLWMRQKPLKVLRHPSSFFVLGASISALLTLNFFISFTFFQTNFPNFFFFFAVEDHFAKALGDTWVKLQKAEEEKRSSAKKSDQTETKKPTLVKASS